MRAVILRLDAPLMSFGSVIVDQNGYTDLFPGTAMLTGLLANALGWHHGDVERLQSLQDRLAFAARWDVAPERLIDYHTVDLGQSKMSEPGWTTRGTAEHRGGGASARLGTHQRYRHYWVDGILTVALTVSDDWPPTLQELGAGLRQPARPLFLGRKTCLPARPLLDALTPVAEGEDLLDILRRVPVWNRNGEPSADTAGRLACWPAGQPVGRPARVQRVFDLRDWANQLPAGSRWRAEGPLREDRL